MAARGVTEIGQIDRAGKALSGYGQADWTGVLATKAVGTPRDVAAVLGGLRILSILGRKSRWQRYVYMRRENALVTGAVGRHWRRNIGAPVAQCWARPVGVVGHPRVEGRLRLWRPETGPARARCLPWQPKRFAEAVDQVAKAAAACDWDRWMLLVNNAGHHAR